LGKWRNECVVNNHSTFFLTGVFSFLVGDFIINESGEAEAALLRSNSLRNTGTHGNA